MSALPIFENPGSVALFWWICYLFFNVGDVFAYQSHRRSNSGPKGLWKADFSDTHNYDDKDSMYEKVKDAIVYYPPDWVFGVVWTILYLCLIIAVTVYYKELNASTAGALYDASVILMIFNFILNKGWYHLFFGASRYDLAALNLLGILVSGLLILIVIALNDVTNHWVPFGLFFAYELWCAFAFVLNLHFWFKSEWLKGPAK